MSQIESTDRPGASGHRFGPDLACSECGISWEEHQRDPSPCRTKSIAADAFERRPEVDPDAWSSTDSGTDSREDVVVIADIGSSETSGSRTDRPPASSDESDPVSGKEET